ncbi:MAG: cyclase family protein [Candidatus Nezhaarchaeota archaeon]|nr:cyclase family protein [Candidatus Nezhaarchaeota archaeon]MCX8141233.1 cyclase family protein [Candidatus Nezhaarchaeota archaeon]MDW8049499.1 cyclase family protein [Nitrososphaerota archaeon]
MALIDLSRDISPSTLVFPSYPSVSIMECARRDIHGFKAEVLNIVTHVSTHVDAPLHFKDGGASIDKLSLELFVGYAVVLDLWGKFKIKKSDLEAAMKSCSYVEGDAVFIYTGWEDAYGKPEYVTKGPGLLKDAAEFLVEVKVKLVGIDSPSIDPWDSTSFDAHHILLGAGIPVIENLCNMVRILKKRVKYYAFPLKITGATASPVRVVVEV